MGKIHSTLDDLPRSFRDYIALYIRPQNSEVIHDPRVLITFWRTALRYRKEFPKLQTEITEWTVSAAASSPLINDNGPFEEIHAYFGSLEVDPEEKLWQRVEECVADLDRKYF